MIKQRKIKMNLIIIGAPASGKGTQAEKLSKEYNLKHISTGELLREALEIKDELIKKYEKDILSGKLVPDKLVINILKKNLPKTNFIIDGSPRTIEQAKEIEKITKIDKVIFLDLEDRESIRRISGRRICPKCKRTYHIETNPPKQKNICDFCNAKLIQREDDKEEVVKERLKLFHKNTEPILDYYKKQNKLIIINGNQSIEKVYKDIKQKYEQK